MVSLRFRHLALAIFLLGSAFASPISSPQIAHSLQRRSPYDPNGPQLTENPRTDADLHYNLVALTHHMGYGGIPSHQDYYNDIGDYFRKIGYAQDPHSQLLLNEAHLRGQRSSAVDKNNKKLVAALDQKINDLGLP